MARSGPGSSSSIRPVLEPSCMCRATHHSVSILDEKEALCLSYFPVSRELAVEIPFRPDDDAVDFDYRR